MYLYVSRGRQRSPVSPAVQFGTRRSTSLNSFLLWLNESESKSLMMPRWETSPWQHTFWICSRFLTPPGMVGPVYPCSEIQYTSFFVHCEPLFLISLVLYFIFDNFVRSNRFISSSVPVWFGVEGKNHTKKYEPYKKLYGSGCIFLCVNAGKLL